MRIYLLLATTAILLARTTSDKMTEQEPSQDDESEQENDTSRKVIGSRYVESLIAKYGVRWRGGEVERWMMNAYVKYSIRYKYNIIPALGH